MAPKENRLPHPDFYKRRNAFSGPSGRPSGTLDPAGNESLEALAKIQNVVGEKRADERNKSSSAISAVTAGLGSLNFPKSDKAKSTQGDEARND